MITKSIYKLPSIKATFLTCTFLSVNLSTKSFVHEQCSINSIVSWQEGKFPSGLVEARLENILVCCQLGVFLVHQTSPKNFIYQFEMEKVVLILIYLMIFKFFIPLHTVCLLLLQCACYHYDFSLL